MAGVLQALDHRADTRVTAVSGLFSTPPWGVEDQPDFLNCCAAIETSLAPEALLDACLALEQHWRRERKLRWGPRTIDIDILAHARPPVDEPGLTIPHPRARERAFVLVPLAEIAPDVMLEGATAGSLAAQCDQQGMKRLQRAADWWRAPLPMKKAGA
ncbi:MAG: 2-amino-4-hydroxy-6-hydroxymethyldihydropteridine diphosphokinase [Brucellaceae bacterium]|nr:2-amino-4-hydroxy-6-hydroxymethyldihydropteridine diphosphokinase [Notoacmeibacter sp.]MCC0027353.1 2-amino-4-hydroxy-6-hydroxymethyldihydropteridine diphosphokinase [Brucellaceae bacterium]